MLTVQCPTVPCPANYLHGVRTARARRLMRPHMVRRMGHAPSRGRGACLRRRSAPAGTHCGHCGGGPRTHRLQHTPCYPLCCRPPSNSHLRRSPSKKNKKKSSRSICSLPGLSSRRPATLSTEQRTCGHHPRRGPCGEGVGGEMPTAGGAPCPRSGRGPAVAGARTPAACGGRGTGSSSIGRGASDC